MSRAMRIVNDVEHLNRKLADTILRLHQFSGQLANIHDQRKGDPNTKPSASERPRNAFFVEIDEALSSLATNLGYLDGLVSNLNAEVFGEPAQQVEKASALRSTL